MMKGAWVWLAAGLAWAGDEPAKAWKVQLVQHFGENEVKTSVVFQGPKYRIERVEGGKTMVRVFNGKDFYRYSDGGPVALKVLARGADIWQVTPWVSQGIFGKEPARISKGTERVQGQSCDVVELSLSGMKAPVMEWVWRAPGVEPAPEVVLKRKTVIGEMKVSMDCESLEAVAALPDSAFELPKGLRVKVATQGRPKEEDFVGKPLDAFSMRKAGGTDRLTSASLKGKVVVVNFFATWCGPCRGEMPELVKFHKEFGPKGVEFVSIDTGEKGSESADDKVAWFVKEYGVAWPIVMDEELYSFDYSAGGIPTNMIVDHQGVIRGYRIGGVKPEWLREQLEAALAARPAP